MKCLHLLLGYVWLICKPSMKEGMHKNKEAVSHTLVTLSRNVYCTVEIIQRSVFDGRETLFEVNYSYPTSYFSLNINK